MLVANMLDLGWVTRCNHRHRLKIGQFRLNSGNLIGQLGVGKDYLMVTVGQQSARVT